MINFMAAVLETEIIDLSNDTACIVALHRAQFTLDDINEWLDVAREEARRLRAQMAEDAQA